MKTVTLTPSEQWFVREITQKRFEVNQERGVGYTPYNNSGSSLETYILGFSGEIAFCKMFNIYPSFEYETYSHYDCVLNGLKIEVKTNTRPDGWLGIKDTPFNVDYDLPAYYALMIGNLTSNTYEFKGFISCSSIINPWHHSEGTYFPMYKAYQNELIPYLPSFTSTSTMNAEGWNFDEFERIST